MVSVCGDVAFFAQSFGFLLLPVRAEFYKLVNVSEGSKKVQALGIFDAFLSCNLLI